MNKKYYFETESSEICFTEDHFQDVMKFDKLTEMQVYKAEPLKDKNIFWCTENSFCGDDTTQDCGKRNCNDYEPRNGKNGRCRFHSKRLFTRGEKVILKFKK